MLQILAAGGWSLEDRTRASAGEYFTKEPASQVSIVKDKCINSYIQEVHFCPVRQLPTIRFQKQAP
jgi:hypothetical protein